MSNVRYVAVWGRASYDCGGMASADLDATSMAEAVDEAVMTANVAEGTAGPLRVLAVVDSAEVDCGAVRHMAELQAEAEKAREHKLRFEQFERTEYLRLRSKFGE